MMRYGDFYGYGMMRNGFGWVMLLLFCILVVIGIIVFLRFFVKANNSSHKSYGRTAINILDERYARGEITDEEYKRKKADIES